VTTLSTKAPSATGPRRQAGAKGGDRGRRPRHQLRLWKLAAYAGILGVTVVVGFPLLWMALTALKSNGQIVDLAAPLWPTSFHFSNILTAWNMAPFARFFLNSAVFAGAATVGQVMTGLMAGYALAKIPLRGKLIALGVILAGLMVPFTTVMVPVVTILAKLHWLNTYQGLIVPNIASALGAFLFRQFFLGTPNELGEAARLDGASEWRVFWRVYRPLAGPLIGAFTIISFLYNWNNFLYPLLVTSRTSMMVVPVGLSVFQTEFTVRYNLVMAASLIAVVPVLLLTLAAQRKIVEGIMLGSLQ
jgi:ABC-type glycerol-3-phosphate transport system permease component